LSAATRTVTNLNDSGSGSLRDTIAAAGGGDEIVFASHVRGTLTLTSGELNISKPLRIVGPGANQLTIARSSASGTPPFRLFHITTTTRQRLFIGGVTLAGGLLTDTFGDGGCIYNNAPQLTIQGVVFRNNRASKNGGAIYNDGTHASLEDYAELLLDACTFTGNYAGESGGVLYNNGSNGWAVADFKNCTLFRNGAGLSAGAAYTVALGDGLGQTSFHGSTVVENVGGSSSSGTSIVADSASVYFNGSVSYASSPVSFVEQNGGRIGSFGYNLGQPKDHPFLNGRNDRLVAAYQLDAVGLQPNGGIVPTIAVVRGSAVDGGNKQFSTDARGRARPYDFSEFPNPARLATAATSAPTKRTIWCRKALRTRTASRSPSTHLMITMIKRAVRPIARCARRFTGLTPRVRQESRMTIRSNSHPA
jgi:predicted outer membrane repeat protein